MKTIVFQNTRFDVDRFFSKRLSVGINMKSNKVMNNILTRAVVMNKTLNLIDKFVILNPLSDSPRLKKKLDVDQSVIDNLKTEITQMAPPHMLMKTTALLGGMDVDSVVFDNDVPLNVSKAVWNIHDSETSTEPVAGQCNRVVSQQGNMGISGYSSYGYNNTPRVNNTATRQRGDMEIPGYSSSMYDIPVENVNLSDNQPMMTGTENDLQIQPSVIDAVSSSSPDDFEMQYKESEEILDKLEKEGKLGNFETNRRVLEKFNNSINN